MQSHFKTVKAYLFHLSNDRGPQGFVNLDFCKGVADPKGIIVLSRIFTNLVFLP